MPPRYHPDPEQDLVLDAASMKALSHPLRMRIVGILRIHGPATATQLAARLGVNTGATSYHLRQLAGAGLIVDDESRGNARDRWWKAAHRATYFESDNLGDDQGTAYLGLVADMYSANMHRAVDELPSLPKDWQKATTLSDYGLLLTATEATSMLNELYTVVSRFRDADADDAPAGVQRVTVQLQSFLTPGAPHPAGGAPMSASEQP